MNTDAQNEVENIVDSNLVQQVQQQNLASDDDTKLLPAELVAVGLIW